MKTLSDPQADLESLRESVASHRPVDPDVARRVRELKSVSTVALMVGIISTICGILATYEVYLVARGRMMTLSLAVAWGLYLIPEILCIILRRDIAAGKKWAVIVCLIAAAVFTVGMVLIMTVSVMGGGEYVAATVSICGIVAILSFYLTGRCSFCLSICNEGRV